MPFIVLGDFNRWMDGNDQVIAALREAAPLARATEGQSSPCWGGERFIDHILAGGAAAHWMQPATLTVQVFRETGEEWKDRLSDHCAVAVHFRRRMRGHCPAPWTPTADVADTLKISAQAGAGAAGSLSRHDGKGFKLKHHDPADTAGIS